MIKNICEISSSIPFSEESIVYLAVCACGSPDHSQHIILELDADNYLHATFYYKCDFGNYYGGAFNSLGKRLKAALSLLFNKEVTLEGDFLFTKDSLASYISALEGGLKKMEK